jgi:hypothetical protein
MHGANADSSHLGFLPRHWQLKERARKREQEEVGTVAFRESVEFVEAPAVLILLILNSGYVPGRLPRDD